MMKNKDENTESLATIKRVERIRKALENTIGYMLPLIVSYPGCYAGLMSAPFLGYILLMFTLQGGESYLFWGITMSECIILILSIALFLYSVIILWRRKRTGLVISGPYRLVRHPQYMALMLFTAVLTSRSVWVILNTFGSGYLGSRETVTVWFVMVLAYIGLAIFEEHHLVRMYQEEWPDYRRRVGFLIPLITNKRRWLEIAGSLIVLTGLMLALLYSNDTLQWLL